MKIEQTQLWLGTQATYESAVEARTLMLADSKFQAAGNYSEDVMRQILDIQDGVAAIRINGSLINGTAGYGIYYGVTGYDDIRNALALAVSNPNVSAILLDVSSGGGHVAGVHETAQLIARVNKVKPVVTYTGSVMGSAAVWTGISGSYVFTSETAIVGSIGIIMVHMERSKQLADMGIKATVIRAGAEKALASPYEPLSDKAKSNMEAQAAELYDVFIKHVAESRGVSVTMADAKFGQGKEFLGKAAVAAGLVDKVGTYEDAFAKAAKLGAEAKPAKRPGPRAETPNSLNVQASSGTPVVSDVHNQATASKDAENPQGTDMLKPLTQEQLAAMAAGVMLEPEATNASSEQPEQPEAGEPAADKPTADTNPAAPEASASADTTSVLLDKLLAASAEVSSLKAELAEKEVNAEYLAAFTEIARASVKTMGLHFGVKADAVAAMQPAEVLAEHSRLAALFKEKFKVGGVAASTPEETQKPKAIVNPMFAAVLRSTAK